jgi:cyclophilin family peptidyl-prolyl cis-trans isomerase
MEVVMSRTLSPLLPFCAVVLLLAPRVSAAGSPAPSGTPRPAAVNGPAVAILETAAGRIVISLAETQAPKTCANFRKLVAQGFYDSTYFHRVIPGFMIQGGDPNTRDEDPFNDGEGGPGWTVPAEIGLPHLRGAVASARLPDAVNPARASSGSQFFICVADRPDLDRGGYTVFGRVISGMDAVDRLVALANTPGIARLASGPNPQKLALVKRAWLESAARWEHVPAPAKK